MEKFAISNLYDNNSYWNGKEFSNGISRAKLYGTIEDAKNDMPKDYLMSIVPVYSTYVEKKADPKFRLGDIISINDGDDDKLIDMRDDVLCLIGRSGSFTEATESSIEELIEQHSIKRTGKHIIHKYSFSIGYICDIMSVAGNVRIEKSLERLKLRGWIVNYEYKGINSFNVTDMRTQTHMYKITANLDMFFIKFYLEVNKPSEVKLVL